MVKIILQIKSVMADGAQIRNG